MLENAQIPENMQNVNWFKLHRTITDTNEFWETKPVPQIVALIDVLLMVNSHKSEITFEEKRVKLWEGERLVSLEQLSERWGWSRTKVRNHLDKWEIKRRIVKSRNGKSSTIIDARTCFWWKVVQKNDAEKDTATPTKKTRQDTENTMLYDFLSDLKKQLTSLQKDTVKKENITNNMEAGASLDDLSLNEWTHKVGLASCYYQKLDSVTAPDFSLMARLIKEHGILLVLAKLEQLAANDLSFKSQADAKRYVIATLKKAAIQQNAPVQFVKKEPSVLDILHDLPQVVRFDDVLKEREN